MSYLRELKIVKAYLAFANTKGAQVEEENILFPDREGSEKGHIHGNEHDLLLFGFLIAMPYF